MDRENLEFSGLPYRSLQIHQSVVVDLIEAIVHKNRNSQYNTEDFCNDRHPLLWED